MTRARGVGACPERLARARSSPVVTARARSSPVVTASARECGFFKETRDDHDASDYARRPPKSSRARARGRTRDAVARDEKPIEDRRSKDLDRAHPSARDRVARRGGTMAPRARGLERYSGASRRALANCAFAQGARWDARRRSRRRRGCERRARGDAFQSDAAAGRRGDDSGRDANARGGGRAGGEGDETVNARCRRESELSAARTRRPRRGERRRRERWRKRLKP